MAVLWLAGPPGVGKTPQSLSPRGDDYAAFGGPERTRSSWNCGVAVSGRQ